MEGETLINEVALATGLPVEWVKIELKKLIYEQGLKIETLNLSHLRIILADYLQDTLIKAKKEMDLHQL
ncbi:MAG: hypothetical protein K1X29_01245 [Bdellovibrionales bacterium]|nr:hypothetical protein [Bdellovibrionales bacterium]